MNIVILMQLNNIIKTFAGEPILNGAQIEVSSLDRIAIVGRNGAGKSTLLKIMTGELDYDSGEFFKNRDLQIGYLAQHNDIHSERMILDEMLQVFTDLIEEEKALLRLAEEIEAAAELGHQNDKLLHEYSVRQDRFAEQGGYRFRSDVKGVLIGLGFPESDFTLRVNDLSGGQKTRLALGKLLLQEPALLILDEPTNHLDIATLTWLENYLISYAGAIVIVSHDRYFLDKIVTIVYEIAYKQTIKYHGSYTKFLAEKALNYERDLRAYEKEQQEIENMEDFIQRNIARASTTKRAQSRRKQLDRLQRMERPLGNESSASFSFQVARTSGNDVLSVRELAFKHPGESDNLFSGVSFDILKGQRIALIGENGVGKTTLLKELMRAREEIRIGTNVQIGYYDQEQANVNPANTLLDEVWDDFPHKDEQEIRTVLGNFLFSGDDVLKHVHTLSGGEKARLALAKLMLLQANFLILDEPTNHLDLISKEILESALMDFEGTILFVSHDRYFINKIAEEVFELTRDGVKVYLGDFEYYTEKKLEEAELAKLLAEKENLVASGTPSGATINHDGSQKLSFQEQKKQQSEERRLAREIERIEIEIENYEERLHQTELAMTNPDIFNDHEKLLDLTNEANEVKVKINQLMEEWETLQS